MAKPVVIKSNAPKAVAPVTPKTSVTAPPAPPADEADDNEAADIVSQTLNTPLAAAAPAAAAPVSLKKSAKDVVVVSCFETIEPAPTIGFWSGATDPNVGLKMLKQTPYKVPRHVAEVLVDAKKAIIVG